MLLGSFLQQTVFRAQMVSTGSLSRPPGDLCSTQTGARCCLAGQLSCLVCLSDAGLGHTACRRLAAQELLIKPTAGSTQLQT